MLCDGVAEFVYLSIQFNDGIIMVIIFMKWTVDTSSYKFLRFTNYMIILLCS